MKLEKIKKYLSIIKIKNTRKENKMYMKNFQL